MVMRSEKVPQVVHERELDRVFALVQVFAYVKLVRREHKRFHVDAVDLHVDRVYAALVEADHRGRSVADDLFLDRELAGEEREALQIESVQTYRVRGTVYDEISAEEIRVVRDVLKAAVEPDREIAHEVKRLDLHIVGELVFLGLEDLRLLHVLVYLGRLLEVRYKLYQEL